MHCSFSTVTNVTTVTARIHAASRCYGFVTIYFLLRCTVTRRAFTHAAVTAVTSVTVKNIGCKKRKTKNPDDGRRVVTTQNQQLNNSRRHLWRDARTIMNVLCRRPELSAYLDFGEERIAQFLDSLLRTKFVIKKGQRMKPERTK